MNEQLKVSKVDKAIIERLYGRGQAGFHDIEDAMQAALGYAMEAGDLKAVDALRGAMDAVKAAHKTVDGLVRPHTGFGPK